MRLDETFNRSHAYTRRGFAGLLFLPAAAIADRNDNDRRRGDYRRGSLSGAWRAFASKNYEPHRADGRFDLRARVDGAAEFVIRGNEVSWRAFNGAPPRDEGCEYRKEIPSAELYGLRLDQRDGRSRMQIVEEPSRRNGWAIVVRVDDHERGDDRYHARITWEADSSYDRGRDRGRSSYQRGR